MISNINISRICLLNFKVDFRRGHDGLLGEAYKLGLAPYQGDMLVFIGRRKDRLKILFADPSGLCLLYKRFSRGHLSKKFKFLEDPLVTSVSFSQVMDLLEWSIDDFNVI